MKKRNWIIGIVSALMITGCVIWEMMALIVSIVGILLYALIIVIFVAPSFDSIKENKDERES